MELQTEKKAIFVPMITAEEYTVAANAPHCAKRLPPLRAATRWRWLSTPASPMRGWWPRRSSTSPARAQAPELPRRSASCRRWPSSRLRARRALRTSSIEGDAVLDLTCGLGVDTLYLSRRFRRVVALESDPLLARITADNFASLGVCERRGPHSSRRGVPRPRRAALRLGLR